MLLAPREQREEWIGDLHEEILKLKRQQRSRAWIEFLCCLELLRLMGSALSIKLGDLRDFIASLFKKRP
ncbi:hypothetical protein KR51_00034640 [Rubidibacter lacunae KORDI 51-2]|uniref:Uncharacterized protein n=1 Tax=Rubidibacter lacunae KORDI 51-2 TaxID=582515 RepID=U5DFY8_9CHRO|nr:hypothetical protein [Rubidibacter lacunae]ERN40172.1 hypothetical protein KR51_00034640 [Rubidibacter lacunae KORDI 51-2]